MKNLAIMETNNSNSFEAIVSFFKNIKDVNIICISNSNDSEIFKKVKNFDINFKYVPFDENLKFFSENKFDLIALDGYTQTLPDEVLAQMGKVINIHPSLLPSFNNSRTAISDALLAGVKVSGITIHWVSNKLEEQKIIAQYPVFINNDTHLDEFESDIKNVSNKLYPIVIEKILENKVFDFQELITPKEDGGCGGCGGNCGGCGNH